MLRIRFRRVGMKGQPTYRIVVSDARSPRDGRFVEVIGFHNPRTIPTTDTVNEERALHWLSVGAQPSAAVLSVFKRTGTWERFGRLRKGEPMEALVAESQASAAAQAVSPKTSHPAPGPGKSWQKARQAQSEADQGS